MRIIDDFSFVHTCLHKTGFCGLQKRGRWWNQFPGEIKVGELPTYIKRTR